MRLHVRKEPQCGSKTEEEDLQYRNTPKAHIEMVSAYFSCKIHMDLEVDCFSCSLSAYSLILFTVPRVYVGQVEDKSVPRCCFLVNCVRPSPLFPIDSDDDWLSAGKPIEGTVVDTTRVMPT